MKYLILTLSLLVSFHSFAADIPGSKDHPMFSRYTESEILKYEQREFDQVKLVKAPIQVRGDLSKNDDAVLKLEGKYTRLSYRAPANRSVFEVYKNYEQALTSAGFEVLYQCHDVECDLKFKGRAFNEAVTPKDMSVYMGFHEKDQRYLLAKLKRNDTVTHVAVYVIKAYGVGGPNKDRIFTNLQIVESADMQTGLVTVDAAAMAKGLETEGHIALYGIYFDTDKSDVKPESDAALKEIATLLQQQPKLNLLVVGHTDNVGELRYNQQLSERRAAAVVDALSKRLGVAKARLTPVGVGMAAPVASNDGEAGRAKNRRVELVKR